MRRNKKLYQCSFCNLSFLSNEKRIGHEKICGKSGQERFNEIIKRRMEPTKKSNPGSIRLGRNYGASKTFKGKFEDECNKFNRRAQKGDF